MSDMIIIGRPRTSIHRHWQNYLLRDFTSGMQVRSVINLGATPDAADKEGGRYCDYFPGASFKSLDTRPYDHPDYIQGDLMDENQGHGPYDLVVAMSIIEHIDKPWKAAPVMSSLVAKGGHLFVAMPWFYPTHEGDDFGDHWRARPSGLAHLFEDLELVRESYFPSALRVVRDRKNYWRNEDSTAAGCAVLFRKS
ncbi:hypothetical protein KUL25_20000 [Rhodobacteraceae bacterium N5(2021)]|uniref:Methyltransferase domain-containing protein n=2 Tax=Gymnodinialimonas phycosphaerae TaxID=2841589 RepID=A0ABS7MY59_9RHOB|nr:hypothetical protein [Gymnodinialimonas phycosphaerae]MBY4895049.1 hypothetical protein [Gymnodinialimonas phycosphaerae]